MKKRLARISPLQLGIVLAVLYALISLIVVLPIGAISMIGGMHHSMAGPSISLFPVFPGLFLLIAPVLYALLGFIGGVIAAAVYNVVAKFTGGIEVTVEDAPEA